MSLEAATYIHQLNPANPSGTDRLKDGDDHIRMIKAALKATFPGLNGPLDASITPALLLSLATSNVPVGMIALFAGSTAPAGWAICDGSTVPLSSGVGTVTTPDLRNRVPVGASTTHALGSQFGSETNTVTTAAAGAHSHTGVTVTDGGHTPVVTVANHALTEAEMPAHFHGSGATDRNGSSSTWAANGIIPASASGSLQERNEAGQSQSRTTVTGGSQGHNHVATADPVPGHSHTLTIDDATGHGHSVTVSAVQPSFALNFIMKI